MSQKQRVLRSLERAGSRGVTQADWLGPHTPDGGGAITRLAARVMELQNDGHRISRGGLRDKCRVYVLEPTVALVEPNGDVGGELFALEETRPVDVIPAIYREAA